MAVKDAFGLQNGLKDLPHIIILWDIGYGWRHSDLAEKLNGLIHYGKSILLPNTTCIHIQDISEFSQCSRPEGTTLILIKIKGQFIYSLDCFGNQQYSIQH